MATLKDGESWVPTNPEGSGVFPWYVEAAPSPLGTSRHAGGPETDAHLKTAPKHENENYDHFTPISGQGSALDAVEMIVDTGNKILRVEKHPGFGLWLDAVDRVMKSQITATAQPSKQSLT